MPAPDVHADLEPLSFLLGAWLGGGDGEFPTIGAFRYGEEMVFEHVGDPFLLYSQRSWLEADEAPLHFERGFVRPAAPGRVELVLAHPLGLTEVAEGTLEGTVMTTASTATGSASSSTWRRR